MHHHCCYICGSKNAERLPGQCRDHAEVYPLKCSQCGLVYLSAFLPVQEEKYYEESHMHEDAVQLDLHVVDAVAEADTARRLDLLKSIGIDGRLLDFGCGDGRVLEGMRSRCHTVCGIEPERRMKTTLQIKNIPVYAHVKELRMESLFDCITLFHVLEHLPDPLADLHLLAAHLQPGGKIIIEVPNADDALLTRYKVKEFADFTYWSCHLYLFTTVTLRMLLEKIGFSSINIWQIQRYGLINHMGWIAQGKPTGLSGEERFSWLYDEKLIAAYERHLADRNCADTIIAECIL